MVWIHRGCVGLASLTMASVYCTKRHGICRPTPMYFYLMDSWQEIKFERDPVSIALVSFFILTVSALQIGIEVKKRKLLNETKKAEKAAEDAKRNLDEARLKLSMSEVMKHEADENGDSNLHLRTMTYVIVMTFKYHTVTLAVTTMTSSRQVRTN